MEIRIYTQQWVGLPQTVRETLATAFNMRKDVSANVVDGTIICDGYSDDMLSVFTVESMQEYLGSNDNDFVALFHACIDKVNGVGITTVAPAVEEQVQEVIKDVAEEPIHVDDATMAQIETPVEVAPDPVTPVEPISTPVEVPVEETTPAEPVVETNVQTDATPETPTETPAEVTTPDAPAETTDIAPTDAPVEGAKKVKVIRKKVK